MKYLLILDWTDNSIEIVRNIPENLWDKENGEQDEDAIINFLWEKCHRFIDNIEWKIVDEEDPIVYKTYMEDGSIRDDGCEDFGSVF